MEGGVPGKSVRRVKAMLSLYRAACWSPCWMSSLMTEGKNKQAIRQDWHCSVVVFACEALGSILSSTKQQRNKRPHNSQQQYKYSHCSQSTDINSPCGMCNPRFYGDVYMRQSDSKFLVYHYLKLRLPSPATVVLNLPIAVTL